MTLQKMAEEYAELYKYIGENAVGINPGQDIREQIIHRQGKLEGYLAGAEAFRELVIELLDTMPQLTPDVCPDAILKTSFLERLKKLGKEE